MFELEIEKRKTQKPKPSPNLLPGPNSPSLPSTRPSRACSRAPSLLGRLHPHTLGLPSAQQPSVRPRVAPGPAHRFSPPARTSPRPAPPQPAASRVLSLPRWAHTPAPSSPLAQRPQPSRRDLRRTLRPGPARRDPGFPFKPPHGGPCDPSPPLQPPQTLAAAALRTQSRAELCTAAGRPLHYLLAPANH